MCLLSSRIGRHFALVAAGLLGLLFVSPAHAEPRGADLDLSLPSTLARVEGQPQPVYPNGPPEALSESRGGLAAQPKPVYPDGPPGAADTPDRAGQDPASAEDETASSEEAEEVVEPPKPIIVANIDKGRQRMTVFVDGLETHTWKVSTGIAGYSTPSGEYTASSMNKIWYSRQWDNAPMPHAVFFTKKGHAIHGTNEVRNLGKPASHGCVRLSPKNAETFFNLVKESGLANTQVVLTGVTPGGEYKITEPRRREQLYRGYYDRNGVFRRYGYNDPPPQVERKRRRLFQPYYDSPPRQYRKQPRRRWFRRD